MTLLEAIKDLCYRLYTYESEYEPKIDALYSELERTNKTYNRLKGKEPNLWLQSITIFFVVPTVVILFCTQILKADSTSVSDRIMVALAMAIPTIVLIILNIIRAKAAYAVRKKRASKWWETTGKAEVLMLKSRIEEISDEARDFVWQNPVIDEIPEDLRTEEDCLLIYKILLQRKAVSLEEAISVFFDIRSEERRREREKEEADRRWEEYTERQDRMQKTLERTERDIAFTGLMIDEMRIRQKYGD